MESGPQDRKHCLRVAMNKKQHDSGRHYVSCVDPDIDLGNDLDSCLGSGSPADALWSDLDSDLDFDTATGSDLNAGTAIDSDLDAGIGTESDSGSVMDSG